MEALTVGNMAETRASSAHNLEHVYFFLDKTTSSTRVGQNQDKNDLVAPSTPPQHRSRNSSRNDTSTPTSATLTASPSTTSSNLNPHAESFSPRPIYSPQDARSSPSRSPEQMYEIRKIEGKGLGLIATTFIPRGTRIIAERPLITIPENLVHLAWGSYCRLSNAQREAFDKLHAHAPDPESLENISRMLLIDYNDPATEDEDDLEELITEQVRVLSTFSANNFNLEPTGLAVYTTSSRLNHSCVPNTYHGFNPNIRLFTVHATRDIMPGEELTINYLGSEADFMVRSQRIELLRTKFGFTCMCQSCSDTPSESDYRRELLHNICWGLGQYDIGAPPAYPFIADSPAEAFDLAVNAVKILQAEGLQSLHLIKALRATSKYALALERWDAALESAYQEQEVEESLFGRDVQNLTSANISAGCWIREVLKAIREALGKKQARKIFAMYDYPDTRQGTPVDGASNGNGKKKDKNKGWNSVRKADHAKQNDHHEEREVASASKADGGTDMAKNDGLKDEGTKAETKSWAKIAAEGANNGSSKEARPALEKEHKAVKDQGK